MKKELNILAVAIVASLALQGCMRNEPDGPGVAPDDGGAIHLDATTSRTRASLSTIDDMHSGFRVFAASARSWYPGIDGTNNHVYSGGQWHFQTPVAWPTDQAKYPMMFYAWYPVDPADHGPMITANNPASIPIKLQGTFAVQPKAADQVDFLVSKSVAVERPVGGNLSMTFDHALSKIDFGIIPGREVTPEIMSLGILNVGDTRTYDFIAGKWTSAEPDLSSLVVYDYYGNFLDATFHGATFSSVPWSPRNGWDEITATSFYNTATTPTAADAHLMLMPQTNPSWDPAAIPVIDVGDGATIVLLYRMTNIANGGGKLDEVGFASARNHPDFVEGGYEGPLYVLAGFPLPADTNGDFTWTSGKGYTYNIGLGTPGSSNGYVLGARYFDENGQLSFELIDGIQMGDPLNDGVIHIELDVDDWSDDDGELPPWVDRKPTFVDERAPYILYWDSATRTMQVGSWNAVSGGNVTTANQLFFQAASVVGFLNAGDGWNTAGSQIMFNPTATTDADLATGYVNIPDWAGSVEATTPAQGFTADGFVSGPNYHYKANVLAGLGDPCKLAGLTEEQVKAGVIDNGKWVMARWDDIRTGYTAYGTTPGVTTLDTSYGMAVNGATDTFLPASGWRNYSSGGAPASIGVQGWYWSSKPMEARYITTLRLDGSTVYSTMAGDGNLGAGVRCVGVTQYPVSVAAGAGGSAAVSLLATANTNARSAMQGQVLTFTASPATDYVFAEWTSTNFTLTDEQKTKNPLSLSMPAGAVTLTATFKAIPPGVRSVGNAPGVIGYIWNPGQPDHLTLTMDKDDGNDTNGKIYVAFFKYGSLVALSSQDNGPFTTDDVVAWPAAWAADRTAMEAQFSGAASSDAVYGLVPYLTTGPIPATNDAAQAQGDPCTFYQSQFGGEWKMPTQAENTTFVGGIGNTTSGWYTYTPASGSQPALGNFPSAPVGPYSLPVTGNRIDGKGGIVAEDVGLYWMNTTPAHSATQVYYFALSSNTSSYSYTGLYTAKAVRCQSSPPTPNPVGEIEIPSIDGTYTTVWAGSNLSAKGVFATTAAADGAYFQWGRDAAYPYNYGSPLPASDTDQTDNATWPDGTNPCPYGWRVPTKEEWDSFFAVMTDGMQMGERTFTSATYGSITFSSAGSVAPNGPGSGQGSSGIYWSSSQVNPTSAYYVNWTTTYPAIVTNRVKTNAISVRCVRTL